MLEFRENVLDKDTYLYLRKEVGWITLSDRQAGQALSNALYTVCAYLDGKPVGMGRVVGDGAVVCYVQDLVVIPAAQGMHIGSEILDMLRNFVESLVEPGTRMMMCLMCAKGREDFYIKHGFIARPTDNLGPGMICYISSSHLS